MKNMMVYPVISLLQRYASTRYWHVWAVALVVSANPALAFEFHSGDLSGSFDTTLSLGIAQRIQSRDASLIGIANGGTSRSVNEDNGDLNYDKNDLYAATIKATHELELKYQNFGAFFRYGKPPDFIN